MNGLAAYGIEPTWTYVDMSTIPQTQARPIPGSNPGLPWLRQSELVVQPGQQQTYPQRILSGRGPVPMRAIKSPAAPRLCGGVQHREIESAGQTTGGACGGTRLGNPCDEDGLTR